MHKNITNKLKVHKQILRLAVPNIITNLTVPLLSMVDLHLMGYLDSSKFMGAIALGGVVFNIIYWGFSFLRMSISGLTAQTYGEKAPDKSALILYQGLFISITGGILLIIFQYPIAQLSFFILNGTDSVKELAKNYYFIRIWAAPAAISLMVMNGWFLGRQNANYPMIISISINIINIILSIMFVKIFNMEEKGVALGSVIAQYIGLITSIILFNKKYNQFYKYFNINKILNMAKLKRLGHVSSDIFIRTLCVISVFTFFTSQSAYYGNTALAANTTLLQFLFIISYFLDGFAYAAEAIVGKYYGQNNILKIKESINKLFIWGLSFGIFFSIIYYFSGENILLIFTDKVKTIEYASKYLNYMILIPIVGFASYIWDGIYIGATASKPMRNTMILSSLIFFISFYALEKQLENNALWISMLLFMTSRSISQSIISGMVIFKKLSQKL